MTQVSTYTSVMNNRNRRVFETDVLFNEIKSMTQDMKKGNMNKNLMIKSLLTAMIDADDNLQKRHEEQVMKVKQLYQEFLPKYQQCQNEKQKSLIKSILMIELTDACKEIGNYDNYTQYHSSVQQFKQLYGQYLSIPDINGGNELKPKGDDKDLIQLRNDNNKLQEVIENLTKRTTGLDAETERYKKECEELEKEIESIGKDNNNPSDEHLHEKEQIEKEKKNISKKKIESEQRRKELDKRSNDLKKRKSDLDKKTQDLKTKESELEQGRRELDKKLHHLIAKENEIRRPVLTHKPKTVPENGILDNLKPDTDMPNMTNNRRRPTITGRKPSTKLGRQRARTITMEEKPEEAVFENDGRNPVNNQPIQNPVIKPNPKPIPHEMGFMSAELIAKLNKRKGN